MKKVNRRCVNLGPIVVIAFIAFLQIMGNGEDTSRSPNTLEKLPYEFVQPQLKSEGELTLNIKESANSTAGQIILEYHFWSGDLSTRVYNPYYRQLIPASFNIVVFDESHTHVGNIFSVFSGGSQRNVGPGDWKSLPENCGVGLLIPWKGGKVHRPWIGDSIQLLPGQYHLQFVANSLFLSPPPQDKNGRHTEDAALGWPHERVNADAMRSNRLKVEIK